MGFRGIRRSGLDGPSPQSEIGTRILDEASGSEEAEPTAIPLPPSVVAVTDPSRENHVGTHESERKSRLGKHPGVPSTMRSRVGERHEIRSFTTGCSVIWRTAGTNGRGTTDSVGPPSGRRYRWPRHRDVRPTHSNDASIRRVGPGRKSRSEPVDAKEPTGRARTGL